MWKRWLGVWLVLALFLIVLAPAVAESQQCKSKDGKPRECTVTETLDNCLEIVVDAAEQRADDEDGSKLTRFVWFLADSYACGAAFVLPIV